MIYNIHYDVCAMMIALCTIVFILAKKGLQLKQNRILLVIVLFIFGASFFDIMSSIANSYVDQWSYGMRDLFNYAYLIFHNGMGALFFIYVASVCGLFFGNPHKKRFICLITLPYICDLLILLLNPVFHWAFYYDEHKIYTHSALFYVLYINAFLYLCFSVVFLLKYGKKVPKGKRAMCNVFVISSLITVVIQMMIPYVLISLCVNSLCFLGILLVIDNEDEILDPISKCFNRRFFIQTNMERMGQGITYHVLSIKILDYRLHTATMGIHMMNRISGKVGTFLESLNEEAEVFYYDKGAFALLFASDELEKELIQEITQRFQQNWSICDVAIQLGIDIKSLQVGEQISSVEEILLSMESQKEESTVQDALTVSSVSDYRRQLSIVNAIKRAMVTDSFEINYQPIWKASQNMIVKAKSIVYLQDEELGRLESKEFMPVAEKNELSNEIGDIILRKVIKTYKERDLEALGIDAVEVSLSRLQCMNAHLKDRVLKILEEYDVEPKHIEFHFSIGSILNQQEMVIQNMTALHKAGFLVCVAGYGNEAVKTLDLLQYPLDGVQIDKQMIKKAMEKDLFVTFIKHSTRMFHEMSISVEIEGVDDVFSKEMAVELGADDLSGDFFSGPVEEESFYRYGRGFNLR